MSAVEVRARFEAPLLRPVLDFAEVWFADAESLVFHDPLAAVTIFDDAVCTFAHGTVTVDLAAEPARTVWQPGAAGAPHEVATAVNAGRFFEDYFGVFSDL